MEFRGQHTHLSCFFQGTEPRDSLGFGERSPRSDAVGVSVILAPPAPFRRQRRAAGAVAGLVDRGEKHSHEAPVQGRNGTLGSGWFRQNEPIAIARAIQMKREKGVSRLCRLAAPGMMKMELGLGSQPFEGG